MTSTVKEPPIGSAENSGRLQGCRQRGFGLQPALPDGLQGTQRNLEPHVVSTHETCGFTFLQVGQELVCAVYGLWRLVRGDLTFGADYPIRTLGLTLDLCFLRSGGLPSWQSFQSVV